MKKMPFWSRIGLLALLPWLCLGLCLTLSGCSDDDEEVVYTHASILVTHSIEAKSVGTEIDHFVFTGYSDVGQILYGPVTYSRAHQILLQAIPAAVTSMSIGYTHEGEYVGYYTQPVSLEIGVTSEITDPEWEYVSELSNLVSLQMFVDSQRVHTGDEARLGAMAFFAQPGSANYSQDCSRVCQWSSDNESVASPKDEEGKTMVGGFFRTITPGVAKITASLSGKSIQEDIEVTDATLTSIAFDEPKLTLPSQAKYRILSLEGTWSDSVKSDVTILASWSCSDNNVAYVKSGVVYYVAASANPVTITASLNVDTEVLRADCAVSCIDAVLDSLKIELTPTVIPVGTDSIFDVFGHYVPVDTTLEPFEIELYGNDYTIDSENKAIATVIIDEDGEAIGFKGVSAGQVKVIAKSLQDEKVTGSALLTVEAAE